jgi:phytoene synthase
MTPADEPPLDSDRRLALSYVPGSRRAAIGALWRLDIAMGAVLTSGREPMISRIKLAWWREALEKLDRERAPAEPVLGALAVHVLPAGISGARLAAMEAGWSVLLADAPLGPSDLSAYASQRGGLLFSHSADLLGGQGDIDVRQAGEAWVLADLARHCGDPAEAETAVAEARQRSLPRRWPSRLRPLGMLAMLARRDLEPNRAHWEEQGSPGRMLLMLRHRLTGT